MIVKEIAKSALVEFLGTFAIVYFGSLNIDLNKENELFHQRVSENTLVNFFILMSFMWISSKQYGSQLNPFFSLFSLFLGKISTLVTVVNILAQLLGSFCGRLFNSQPILFYQGKFGITEIMFLETLGSLCLTMIFLFTTMNYKSDKQIYGYAYPAGLCFLMLTFGNMYYSRYNILWTFLPQLLSGLNDQILYTLLGNLAGSTIGFLIYMFLYSEDLNKAPEVFKDEGNVNF